MSDAAAAMVSLQVPTDVANRVCDAMAGVAAADGSVTGAQLLRIVVDEGVSGLTAMELRRRLRITAAVPPRRVRWLFSCAGFDLYCCGSASSLRTSARCLLLP
jgi:hypothetical protein